MKVLVHLGPRVRYILVKNTFYFSLDPLTKFGSSPLVDDCQYTNLTKLKKDPPLMYILVHSSLFLGGKNLLKSEIKNKKIFEIFNHNIFERNLGKFCQIF